MSTTPTSIATEVTQALTELETTAATIAAQTEGSEAALDFNSIKEMMDAFDPAALLPDLTGLSDFLITLARWAMLIGPIVLLGLGLAYLFLAPKEANYRFGYRCYHGMGSVEAWRFTQRLAGIVLGGLGLVLTVVMFVISGGYAGKEVLAIVDSAVTCLIWEIVLAVVGCLLINVIVMINFNSRGSLRKK